MLIMLSSCKRKRYRDDVLRCLAAPKGGKIQFRYSKKIVSDPIWDDPRKYEGQSGLVCSVNLEVVGKSCPLVPVRAVIIDRIFIHGTTLSVSFTIDDLAFTEDIQRFTEEVSDKSDKQIPFNIQEHSHAEGSTGLFFFELPDPIDNLSRENTIANWERITTTLYKQPGYSEEQFFWTVLGIRKTELDGVAERENFEQWKALVSRNKDYTLLIYVYHPLTDRWNPTTSRLALTSGVEISTSSPHDLVIDSPYDMRRWSFRISSEDGIAPKRAWIKIGPVVQTGADATPAWEIDLPLEVRFPWLSFVGSVIPLGLAIALPSVIAIWLQQNLTTNQRIGGIVSSIVLGFIAAVLTKLGIKKAL